MRRRSITRRIAPTLWFAVLAFPSAAFAQQRFDPAAAVAAQREALQRFAALDGEWRGTAWMMLPSGERRDLVQTERVGPFLDGAVRVIEGRGHEPDGTVSFNALGIISFDPGAGSYSMRSYARGQIGDFEITPTEGGFRWEIPAGAMTIRYEAEVDGETWTETGTRIAPGREPAKFFEAKLTRVGDTDWPAAGAVGPE